MRAGTAFASIRWGAVLLGLTSGLLVMALLALAGFLLVNLVEGGEGIQLAVLAIANFTAQILAGYVAGRFSSQGAVFNGSLAGLGFFAVSTALQVLGGSRAGLFTFLAFGVISAVLGAAGGALASRRR
ncbi:MAG: hypothetical protein ACE5MI_09400 [Acidimicrobiia bacterium]